MTPFSSGLSMLEKLTRATPPMLKETKRSERSGFKEVLLQLPELLGSVDGLVDNWPI